LTSAHVSIGRRIWARVAVGYLIAASPQIVERIYDGQARADIRFKQKIGVIFTR
jgi:hypothetical protein